MVRLSVQERVLKLWMGFFLVEEGVWELVGVWIG